MAIDSLAGMKSNLNKVTKQLQSMQGVLGGRGLVFSMRDLSKTVEKQNALAKLTNAELRKMTVVLPKVNDALSLTNKRLNLFAKNLNDAKDAVRSFTKSVSRGASIKAPPKGTIVGPNGQPIILPSKPASNTTSNKPNVPGAPNVPGVPKVPAKSTQPPPNSLAGRIIAAVRTKNSVQHTGRALQLSGFGMIGQVVSAIGNAIKIATTPLLLVGTIFTAAVTLFLSGVQLVHQTWKALAKGGMGYQQAGEQMSNFNKVGEQLRTEYGLWSTQFSIDEMANARLSVIREMGTARNEQLMINMTADALNLQKSYGVSYQTSSKVMGQINRMNGGNVQTAKQISKYLEGFAYVNKANMQDLWEDMAANSEEMAKNSGNMVYGFIDGLQKARQWGVSMQTVSNLMDKFSTDFQGTLEMQAKIQTFAPGADISEAIYAANFGTTGQFADALKASVSQLGGIDSMSRGMKNALASSFGMSVSELTNLIKAPSGTTVKPTDEQILDAQKNAAKTLGDLTENGILGVLKIIQKAVAWMANSWIFGKQNPEKERQDTIAQAAMEGKTGWWERNKAAADALEKDRKQQREKELEGKTGFWERLFAGGIFDKSKKYHTGGLAQNELSAVLKKGEIVLTPAQQKSIGAMINEGMIQRDKIQSQFSQFRGGSGPGLEYALSSMGVNPSLASKSGRQTFAVQSAVKVANKMGAGKLITGIASKALGATALGSKIGAAVGSIIPGAGTLVGALAGGAIGKAVGGIGKAFGGLFGKKKKKSVDLAPDLAPSDTSAGYSTDSNGYVAGGNNAPTVSGPDLSAKFDELIGLLKSGGVQAVVYMDGKKVSDSLMAANRG